MTTRRLYLILLALQVLFLAGWAGYNEYVRRTAPVVKLKVLPVDPRDLLRGDYMILRYEISRHPAPAEWTEAQRSVWVGLREVDGLHQIDAISLVPERPHDRERHWVRATADRGGRSDDPDRTLRLRYGIEHFFVPEGRGTPRFDRLEVEASVSPLGDLHLKRVWLDGEIYP